MKKIHETRQCKLQWVYKCVYKYKKLKHALHEFFGQAECLSA